MGGGQESSGASYLQLYLRALGADSQQMGYLNSFAAIARGLVGLPLGWISDRISLKKVVVFGYMLSIVAPAAFALSLTWTHAIVAMMLNQITNTIVGMFVAQFFVTSVRSAKDRGTAMSMRSTLIGVTGLAVPTISAIVVLNFGGISVEGIRPLFIIEVVIATVIAIYAALKLKEAAFLKKKDTAKRGVLRDYKEIARIPSVQKWTIFKGLRQFFASSLIPFYSIYHVEVKGANEMIIALMATVTTLTALILLVPFGRLADKHGRKRIIFLTRPFYYISILLVIWAPSPEYLVIASFFGALQAVSNLMEITMEWELVPENQRGRLGGFNSFLWGLTGIPGPILAGYLWERVNPSFLLLIPLLVDIPFMIMLMTIPDTLNITYGTISPDERVAQTSDKDEKPPS